MVTRRTSRNPAKKVLTVALLALAATSSVTSGAKCYPKNPAVPSVTPAPDTGETPSVDFGFTGSQQNDPTQGSAGAPTTESSGAETPTTGSSGAETPTTESSGVETPTTESSGAETPTTESSGTGQNEDTEVTQGSAAQTQGSSAEQTGNSTSTGGGEHATFGKKTSTGTCVTGDPETYVTREQIDWVWKNNMNAYVPQFENLIFDQLVTNKGKLQYCVRWDTDVKLEKATASKFQDMLTKQINLWNEWLVGYECWPIDKIDIEITGWAVKDKSIMDWTDDTLGTIYEGDLDPEGIPKCPDACYKHQNKAASADTSGCKGKPFDMSFWPSTKPGDGAIGTGGDWGQRVEINDMLASMDQDHMLVLLHEMGHGFGLPEMYVDKNKPAGYPACVMDSDAKLTPGDGWLLRVILENIKSRYSFGK
ncbi:Neutral zinc metallopeptidase [Phytophthora megakarya]|uniref:Neutral zinc metallopeptidase n=1 Tax=Phytophthora megakarya TaxID=4795 RepID=A0A225VME7_9STRA|nr:Neutral zinc metallopeptidase [Phytophthora megakarya]